MSLSTTDAVVDSWTVAHGDVLGVYMEFTVSPKLPCELILRTFVGDARVSTAVAPSGDGHVRGWWPHSIALFNAPGDLDTNPGSAAPGVVVCPVEESKGGFECAFGADSPELAPGVFGWQGATLDPHGGYISPDPSAPPIYIGNEGLYGADIRYAFLLFNSDPVSSHAAWFYMHERNKGNQNNFFGAVHLEGGGFTYPNKAVGPMGCDPNPPGGVSQCARAWISVDAANANRPIIVPPIGPTVGIVTVAVAGAAGLPVNIVATRIDPVPG